MSLIAFHRGLIAAAIAFCFGYGAWELLRHPTESGSGSLAIGVTFLLLGVGLAFYLSRLNRFLGREERRE